MTTKTYSFKNDEHQSHDVYKIGKIGELACLRYFERLRDQGKVEIVHTPFRDNYDKMNFKDDFILFSKTKNKNIQYEIRTKARNVDPLEDYECCTDCIKPNLTYIFVSVNRKTNKAFIVGWADWDVFREHATLTSKGSENNNFKHKTTEFNIKIKHLKKLH